MRFQGRPVDRLDRSSGFFPSPLIFLHSSAHRHPSPSIVHLRDLSSSKHFHFTVHSMHHSHHDNRTSPSTQLNALSNRKRGRNSFTQLISSHHPCNFLDQSRLINSHSLSKSSQASQDSMKNTPNSSHPNYLDQQSNQPSQSSLSNLIFNRFGPVSKSDSDHSPPQKRRKGVAGVILSTALDAALFTSAVGYAAYQLWCGKRLEEDDTQDTQLLPHFLRSPPPPYAPCDPNLRTRPTQRRPAASRSSSRLPRRQPLSQNAASDSINFILRPESLKHESIQTVEGDDLMSDFVSSLKPYEPPPNLIENDDDEEDDDEEMKAFKAQIKGLIQDGQAALASRPQAPPLSIQPQSFPNPATLEATVAAKMSTDENVKILQSALEHAAKGTNRNWWER
ncbi:hypothetical protein O181_072114 [Austropuccinia psidii MF-1]|uniref:Uncharacterized protein n=1 Tax=Austropuccinia psidii MF-1 TaxID=1389203 RepID=A0A9Q3F4J9_9BASI|nr:hypothetical protein [Austropuccinia psidii MF-1]